MKPLAIVGLDPGTTTAFAALTLQGDLLTFFSAKELSLSDVIRELITICHPVIAATDKSKIPTFIEQFSRKMGTDTIYPHEDLPKEEKRQIISAWTGKNNIKLNHHEADALAAALYAYKHHQPFLEKIYNYIETNNLHTQREEFIRIALNRELHFDVIKEILTKNKEEKKIIYEALVDNKITKKDFLRLYTKLEEIKKENAVLELKLSESFEKMKSLQSAQKKVANIDDQVQKRLDHLVHHKEERLRLLTQKIETVQKQLQQVQAKSHQ
jgi:predicted RNase H-like nuclease (RuvC/YqgF family)